MTNSASVVQIKRGESNTVTTLNAYGCQRASLAGWRGRIWLIAVEPRRCDTLQARTAARAAGANTAHTGITHYKQQTVQSSTCDCMGE